MTRSKAIEVIARHLGMNAGRVAALAQRVAEAGELPKAVGRAVPDLSPSGLAKLLICAIADRGLGNAASSVREFAALRSDGGATLLDLLEAWFAGTVAVDGIHSVIAQLEPAAVTVVTGVGRLHYGAPREQGAATHVVTIPGSAIRAIVAEFRGAPRSHEARAAA